MTALYLHEDAKELLAGKTLVVIGDSVERSVYKDLVCLLQENRYLTDQELRKKGEASFIGDELLDGGVKGEMKNSIDYRECRYFKADNDACCRYYFVTICYGDYVEEILQQLSLVPTDIIVMNSCLWDVHRHGKKGIEKYEDNLEKLVASLRRLLPDCLFIWLTTPPVHIKSKGGFLMRPGTDLVKINEVKFCNEIARDVFTEANNIDRRFRIVDLDAVFKFFEHHRATDGVHWNERAHRRMSNLILEEVSKAFNKPVPRILGRYDNFENNIQKNQFENFHEPRQPLQWDEFEHDMGWGQRPPPPGPDWNREHYNENGWGYPDERPPMGGPPGYHGFNIHGHAPPRPPFGPPIEYLPELDDLSQARHIVEFQQQVRNRNNRSEEVTSPNSSEKKYRFGVAQSRKRTSSNQDEPPAKVTIVDTDGTMKKLIELSDGVTLHAVMTAKEKDQHLKELKEKEQKEQQKKEREEKERLQKEERERIAKEKQQKVEEEKKKNLEEKEITGELKEALDTVSKLPLVSKVPSEKDQEKDKPEKKEGMMSKFASKLLGFIKNPTEKQTVSNSNSEVIKSTTVSSTMTNTQVTTAPTDTTNSHLLTKMDTDISADSTTVIESVSIRSDVNTSTTASITTKPLSPILQNTTSIKVDLCKKINSNSEALTSTSPSIDSTLPSIPSIPVAAIISTKTPTSTKPPSSLSSSVTAVSKVTTKPTPKITPNEPIVPSKPIDTMALLSQLSSPFAKPKTKSQVQPPVKIRQPDQSQQTNKPDIDVSNSEHDLENSLLEDADETLSDVDESILDDSYVANPPDEKPPVVQKPKTMLDQKPAANSVSAATKSNGTPKLPTQKKKATSAKPSTLTGTPNHPADPKAAKKKKKDKHPNETKEERRLRKKMKKEKKEKIKAGNEKKKAALVLGTAPNIGTNMNPSWNTPIQTTTTVNRKRSATWAPSYYPSYESKRLQQQQQHQQQQQNPLIMPQNVPQQPAQQNIGQSITINSYQNPIVSQQRQIIQQRQQHQQSQIFQAQQQQQQQQQRQIQPVNALANKSAQQLYIDEFGQTYTLEEETYIVGPNGQMQTLNAGGTAYLQQQQQQQQQLQQQQLQHHQQQGFQQQLTQPSLIYAQQAVQQQARYI